MRLVEFTMEDGNPIYINPEHVVSIMNYDGVVSEVHLTAEVVDVQGSLEFIADRLAGTL